MRIIRKRKLAEKFLPYVMVAPAMIFLLLFTFYPMINLIYLSLFDYNLISRKDFIGLRNYHTLFFVKNDFLVALKNTGVYTILTVGFVMAISILYALWLQKNNSLDRFSQTAIFTPHLVAMISCGLIWAWIMEPETGLLNAVFKSLGLPRLRWLNSSDTAMISIVIVSVWKSIGYYSIIIMAALKSIPAEIYEAADLDNASNFRRFFKITLPMISPQLFFLLIIMTIGSFKVFDTVRVMTGGGPGNATDVITYFIYRNAFNLQKIGYASAAGTVLMIILMIMTLIYFRFLGKKVHYQ